jgi:hypothetical protein
MDVAQTFKEAQATTETEVTAQGPISHAVPRQVEFPQAALPIEKPKLGLDKRSYHVTSSLAEEGLSTRQALKPKLNMQKDVEINSNVRGQEKTYQDNLSPVQQDTRYIEIRE